MPAQLDIRDIIIYYIVGVLYILLSFCLYYNITGVWIFDFKFSELIYSIISFALSYIIGFCSPNSLSYYYDKNKQIFILNKLLMIKNTFDNRILSSESLKYKLSKNILLNTLNIDIETISDSEKKEVFYIVLRYIFNTCSIHIINMLKRNIFIVNLYTKLVFFFMTTLCVILINLFIKIFFDIGKTQPGILFALCMSCYFLLIYISKRAQNSINVWTNNTWRALITSQNHQLQ